MLKYHWFACTGDSFGRKTFAALRLLVHVIAKDSSFVLRFHSCRNCLVRDYGTSMHKNASVKKTAWYGASHEELTASFAEQILQYVIRGIFLVIICTPTRF